VKEPGRVKGLLEVKRPVEAKGHIGSGWVSLGYWGRGTQSSLHKFC